MVQGMEIRNKFYDSYSARNPAMFGVREAAQTVQGSLGIASMMNQTTSIFIIDQKTRITCNNDLVIHRQVKTSDIISRCSYGSACFTSK